MTREEAIKESHNNDYIEDGEFVNLGADVRGLINKIYDDFESRTCENCKHWQRDAETPSKGICEQLGIHNIGGCGDYFEKRFSND